MSTASPDTCRDVVPVATHRAASASEPYLAIASRRSWSSYAGERQPLLTTSSTPSAPASVAARRRARRRAASRLATPGTSSSKTVVPAGTAPPASPSASRRSLPERSTADGGDEGEGTSDLEPSAATIATMATTTPAAWRRRIRVRQVVARAGLLRVTPPLKAAWCCQHVCDFRYADDMPRLVGSERARADRRGRALYGGSHPRRPTPRSDRGRRRR